MRINAASRVVLFCSWWTAPVFAADIGYAQATSYFKQDSRPTLYQPLNLLDARDATAWCTPTSDPLNELLTFGFNGDVAIDEIRISTGNNFDQTTWADFGRARKFRARSGKGSETFSVEDIRGLQSISLKTPLAGQRFALEVLEYFPSDDPAVPVCITDIIFVSEGKPLNGAWLTPKLKFDKGTASVMGTWYSGYDGTPDRFLSFHYNGVIRLSVEPYDPSHTPGRSAVGTYTVSDNKLTVDLGGRKYPLQFKKELTKSGQQTLSFEGDLPADLKGLWRSAP